MQQEHCVDNQNTNNQIRAADSSICLEPELIRFGTDEPSVMMEKSQRQQIIKGRSNRPSLTESINSIIQNMPSFMNVGPNANQGNITNSKRLNGNPKRPSLQQSKQLQQQLQIIIDQHWNLNSESLSSDMISMIQSKIAESSAEGMEQTFNLGNLSIFADSAKIKSMFNIQESKRSQQQGGQEEGGTGISGMKKKTNLDKLELDVIDEISSIWQIENQESVQRKSEVENEPVKKNGLFEFFSSAPLAIASQFVSKQQGFSQKIKLWNILKKREEQQPEKSTVTNDEENYDTDRGTGLAESSKTLSIVDEQKQHLSRITSASSDLTVIPQLRNEDEQESESNQLIHSKQSCGEYEPNKQCNGESQLVTTNKSNLELKSQSNSQKNSKQEEGQIQIASKQNNQLNNCRCVEIIHKQKQTSEIKTNNEMPLRKKRSLSVSQADQKLKIPSEQQSKVSSQSKIEQISNNNIKLDKQNHASNLKMNLRLNLAQLNASKICLDKSRGMGIHSHRSSNNQTQLDQKSDVKKNYAKDEKLNSCRDHSPSLMIPSSPLKIYPVVSAKKALNNLKKVNLDCSLTSNFPQISSRLSQNTKQSQNLQQQQQLKKNIQFRARNIPQLVLQKLVIDANSIECSSHSQQQSHPSSKSPIPFSGRHFKNSSVRNPLAQKQTQISTLSHLYDVISSTSLGSISSHQSQKTEFHSQSQLFQQQARRQDSIENHILTQRSSYSTYLNDQQVNNKEIFSYSVGRNLNEGSGIFSTKMPSVIDQSLHTTRRNKQNNIYQHLSSMSSQTPDKQRQHNNSYQGGGSAQGGGGNPVDTLKTARKAKIEQGSPLNKPSTQISTSPTPANKLNSIAVVSQFSSKLKNRKVPLRGVQSSQLNDSLDGSLYNLDSFQVRKAQLFDRSNTNN